jgi:hypothetical protein
MLTPVIRWVNIVSSGMAAGLWLRSALITVPNNIDTIVSELHRAGNWNAAAAACAFVAFACQTYIAAKGA